MLSAILECPTQAQDEEKQLFADRSLKCEYHSTLSGSEFRLLTEFLEKSHIETKIGGTYKVRTLTFKPGVLIFSIGKYIYIKFPCREGEPWFVSSCHLKWRTM